MSNGTIYRYEIPVDDSWHTLRLFGEIVHIDARQPETVEIWARTNSTGQPQQRTFRAYGTGQPLPNNDAETCIIHVATVLSRPHGHFVWHLFELVTLDGLPYPGATIAAGEVKG